MSKVNGFRVAAALVAPLLSSAIFNFDAKAGHREPIGPPCPPICTPCLPADPCQVPPTAPVLIEDSMLEPMDDGASETIAPPTTPQPETSFPPELSEPVAQPEFDLSAGLATNFGAGGARSLAFADNPVTPGYIESAVIQNRVRIRYDDMQNATGGQRERAGFMYPTPSSFNGAYSGGRGPDYFNVPNELDVEEMSVYVETAFRDRFSLFIDVPFRWLTLPDNAIAGGGGEQRGVGDISAGFRWGWIATRDEHLTLQVRTRVPSGDFERLLGTGNTSIDFGLLYDQLLGERTRFYAELNDWQTLDAVQLTPGTITDPGLLNLDANILRSGIGLGYDLLRCRDRCQPKSVTALVEVVGWTILDGNTPTSGDILEANGDTIVNGKYGIRTNLNQHSLYVGYGHNWTNDFWYTDLLRFEWQRSF